MPRHPQSSCHAEPSPEGHSWGTVPAASSPRASLCPHQLCMTDTPSPAEPLLGSNCVPPATLPRGRECLPGLSPLPHSAALCR